MPSGKSFLLIKRLDQATRRSKHECVAHLPTASTAKTACIPYWSSKPSTRLHLFVIDGINQALIADGWSTADVTAMIGTASRNVLDDSQITAAEKGLVNSTAEASERTSTHEKQSADATKRQDARSVREPREGWTSRLRLRRGKPPLLLATRSSEWLIQLCVGFGVFVDLCSKSWRRFSKIFLYYTIIHG